MAATNSAESHKEQIAENQISISIFITDMLILKKN